MKSSLFRFALSLLALPLVATAAVSALNNGGNSVVANDVASAFVVGQPQDNSTSSFRHHVISIDDDGVVRGRIVGLETGVVTGLDGMKVIFIQDGAIVSQVNTREDGSFRASGLAAGDYSFVATGAKGFAAFGVKVVKGQERVGNNLIEVGAVSPKFERLTEIMSNQLPGEILELVNSAEGEAARPGPGANRVAVVGGKLKGTLSTLGGYVPNARIYLIHDKKIVAEGVTDQLGKFELNGVESGAYEFVATSPDGFAAISFEAVAQSVDVGANELDVEGYSFVSVSTSSVEPPSPAIQEGMGFDTGSPADSLDVTLTNPGDQVVVMEQFDDATAVPVTFSEPFTMGTDIGTGIAEGGFYGGTETWGGYGYNGGGGFGGGNLGGLAGLGRLAILGWILTELFNEIDFEDNDNNLPPASPSRR